MLFFLRTVTLLAIAIYGSLIVKITDKNDMIRTHNQDGSIDASRVATVITDLEAFNQILMSSSKGERKDKFLLLNLIVKEEEGSKVFKHLPTPDLLVATDLILRDLKRQVPVEIDVKDSVAGNSLLNQHENMYSVTVGSVEEAKELTTKVNTILQDKKIACFVFLISSEDWNAATPSPERQSQNKQQHVLLPRSSRQSERRDKELSGFAAGSTSDYCPATLEDCARLTGNCSNHGACIQKNHPRKKATNCFVCSCTVKRWTDDKGKTSKLYTGKVDWTGPACQYQDISVFFHIVFWTSLLLLIVVGLSVGLLYDIGEGGAGFGVAGSGIANRLKQE